MRSKSFVIEYNNRQKKLKCPIQNTVAKKLHISLICPQLEIKDCNMKKNSYNYGLDQLKGSRYKLELRFEWYAVFWATVFWTIKGTSLQFRTGKYKEIPVMKTGSLQWEQGSL